VYARVGTVSVIHVEMCNGAIQFSSASKVNASRQAWQALKSHLKAWFVRGQSGKEMFLVAKPIVRGHHTLDDDRYYLVNR